MSYKRIDVQEAQELIKENQAQVIDVRDPMSYQAGHIPNSKLVNDENVEEFLQQADKTQPLIVCCYHGNMSQGAADYFSSKGFEATYSLDGGFEAWSLVSR
ncbi:MAG: thiosulfate sulfurtransferase [Candidatus Latescibacterota bacterium]|jgi:thiosulfate sulfurtransferase